MSIEPVDIDRVEFRKVAEGTKLVPAVWDVIAPSGVAVARAEVFRPASDINVRIPPSPALSAHITKVMYLSDTVKINSQKMSDRKPKTASRSTPKPN